MTTALGNTFPTKINVSVAESARVCVLAASGIFKTIPKKFTCTELTKPSRVEYSVLVNTPKINEIIFLN